MNHLLSRFLKIVGASAVFGAMLPAVVFAATLDELSLQVQSISRDVASISATTTPEMRVQILSSAASRLAVVASELRVIKREETLARISRELASTTAEVMSITSTTPQDVRAGILSRALGKLAQFAIELRALDGATTIHLKLGDRGTGVMALQMTLKADATLYPSGLVTGYFGTMTEEAVRAFQTRYGLAVNGQVDSVTLAKLIQIFGTSASGIGTNSPIGGEPSSGGPSGGGKG